MNQEDFKKLKHRDRWEVGKTLAGVLWCCENCGALVDDGQFPKPLPAFPGMTLHCGECDYELSRRTGGGQGDPFNFTFIISQ